MSHCMQPSDSPMLCTDREQASSNDNWPPKSPHQVLLSTPGGRERLKRLAERSSPSPSPTKRFKAAALGKLDEGMELGDSGEDDEETLELKLQEIQARLKLKKLQKRTKQSSDTENEYTVPGSAPLARASSAAAGRSQSRVSHLRDERLQRSKSQASSHVEVPVSPVRRRQPAELQTSPKRILLGIDKGIKASEISLKRAPSLRKQDTDLKGPFLQRAGSQAGPRNYGSNSNSLHPRRTDTDSPPTSFNERLLATRVQEAERVERDLRIQKNRSKGFDLDQKKMQNFRDTAVELLPSPQLPSQFSRDEILSSFNKPSSNVPRSQTAPNFPSLRSGVRNISNNPSITSAATLTSSTSSHDHPDHKKTRSKTATEVLDSEASSFEPFSSTHLSKRIIPHKELTRILSGKKTFVIPDLLRTVKSPDFSTPDIEEDMVIIATIASKSEPKSHQAASSSKSDNRGKFMIMTLTDLKWELDLFLFDTAFEQFWKLTPGTIIAILNPGFMPPPKGKEATGKFSLTLNSSSDTILEIGSSRDLGFCKSIKKDGKSCDSWVDKRHTEFCNFHVNMSIEKAKSNRMELNTMTFGKGRGRGTGGFGERKFNSRDMAGMLEAREKEKTAEKTRYDRGSHSQIYISKRSTASMLDDVDYDADAFHRGSKEERITKQILAKEKERELAKKLGGGMGTGLGADYMRKKTAQVDPTSNNSSEMHAEPPPDAAALGLLNGKAMDMQLGPIKRKRTNTVSSSAAVGWGGNLTKELGRMKNGESLQPIQKKTRFVTEKGIREAGRESFGGDAVKVSVNDFDDDDDDDDLDIVRE